MISHIHSIDYNSSLTCFAVAQLKWSVLRTCWLTRRTSSAGLKFHFYCFNLKMIHIDFKPFTSKSTVVNASDKTEISNVKS